MRRNNLVVRIGNFSRLLVTLRWFLCHSPGNNIIQCSGKVIAPDRERWNRSLYMLLNNLFACFASEHAMTCEHTIEYRPKGINVSVRIHRLTENLLWRRSADLVHAIYTFCCIWYDESGACIQHAYHSEIRDKQGAILPDED